MGFEKRTKAVKLRKSGKSYSEIKKLMGVSKSTLSNWLREIELTPDQKLRLTKRGAAAYKGSRVNQLRSLLRKKRIREEAKRRINLLVRNPLFISGLMLYWAEGSKNSGMVHFSNSDPEAIELIMRWFREICHVPENKFRVGLFLHTLHVRRNCQNFWHKITGVPLNQFNRPHIKPTIHSNRKKKLYEGTCVIKIHSVDLLSKIQGWRMGVREYFRLGRSSLK